MVGKLCTQRTGCRGKLFQSLRAASQRLPHERNETGPEVQRMVAELSYRLPRIGSPRGSNGSRRTPKGSKVYGSSVAIDGRCRWFSINRKELGLQPLGKAGSFASRARVSCWHPPHTSKRHLLIRGLVQRCKLVCDSGFFHSGSLRWRVCHNLGQTE